MNSQHKKLFSSMHLRASRSPHLSLPAPASLRCCLWICHFLVLNKKGLLLKLKPRILSLFSGHVYQYFLGLVSILLLDGFARCCLYKIAGDPEKSLRLYVTTAGSVHSLCQPPNRSCYKLETTFPKESPKNPLPAFPSPPNKQNCAVRG